MVPDGGDSGDFAPGVALRAGDYDLEVQRARPYRDRGLIVAFAGIDDRDSAETLRGLLLTRPAAGRRASGEGEFRASALVGLEAVAPGGMVLGRVVDVVTGGLQDRLVVVTSRGDEVQVPFVEQMVSDPAGGRIVIDAPEGLFPE